MFFQWLMCTMIWLFGQFVYMTVGAPSYESIVVLGGALWSIGNATVVPCVKLLGLTLGVLVWSVTNLFMGWASARFGLFGIHRQEPSNVAMNSIGIVFCLLSLGVYAFIKTSVSPQPSPDKRPEVSLSQAEHADSEEYVVKDDGHLERFNTSNGASEPASDWTDKVPSRLRKPIGFGIALGAYQRRWAIVAVCVH
jgi:hypothetical protein